MSDRASRFTARASRHASILAVVGFLALTTAVRLRLADAPLERDEGEYAYVGQLLLDGVPPYTLAYNMKLPGIYYTYAAIMAAFGETPVAIRIGLALATTVSTLLLFALGRRLLGPLGGTVGALVFATLSIDRSILGFAAHATHFALVPALAAALLFERRARSATSLVWAGLSLGIAVLITQQLVFAVALAMLFAFREGRPFSRTPGVSSRSARAALVLIGALVPLAIVALILATEGVLGRVWFWVVRYGAAYASQVSIARAPLIFAQACHEVATHAWPLWLAGLIGFIELQRPWWTTNSRTTIRGILFAGLLGILPGFYFREHYFVLLLPAVALGAGVFAASASQLAGTMFRSASPHFVGPAIVCGLILAFGVAERGYLFLDAPERVIRGRYGPNPFAEARQIGEKIRSASKPSDRILVLGSEPEINFYAQRRSSTGYIYAYVYDTSLPTAQPYAQQMQAELRREVDANPPEFVVLVGISTSWYDFSGSGAAPPNWTHSLIARCYQVVGVTDIVSPDQTVFVWGPEAASYVPRSTRTLVTYQRNGDAGCHAAPKQTTAATPVSSAH